jgi:hypothetical protein
VHTWCSRSLVKAESTVYTVARKPLREESQAGAPRHECKLCKKQSYTNTRRAHLGCHVCGEINLSRQTLQPYEGGHTAVRQCNTSTSRVSGHDASSTQNGPCASKEGGARTRATRKFCEFVAMRKTQRYNSLVCRGMLGKAAATNVTSQMAEQATRHAMPHPFYRVPQA